MINWIFVLFQTIRKRHDIAVPNFLMQIELEIISRAIKPSFLFFSASHISSHRRTGIAKGMGFSARLYLCIHLAFLARVWGQNRKNRITCKKFWQWLQSFRKYISQRIEDKLLPFIGTISSNCKPVWHASYKANFFKPKCIEIFLTSWFINFGISMKT